MKPQRNKLLNYCLLCLFLAYSPLCSFSQQLDTLKRYQLNEAVITGTRSPQRLGSIPHSVSIVSRNELESSGAINTLSRLDDWVPGLFLNERGIIGFGIGPVSAGNLSIRGRSGTPNTQVLVLIDGQPQYMGIFGHPIQDNFMVSDIEKVEVLRGPASMLYGSNAFGGAINLITRSGKPKESILGGEISLGSFNTQHYQLHGSASVDSLRIFASINHQQTNGHRTDGDDDFNATIGNVKLDYHLSEKYSLALDANLSDTRFLDPGQISDVRTDNFYEYLRGRTALTFSHKAKKLDGSIKAFYNFGEHDFFDGWHSEDRHLGITAYENLRILPGHTITLGFDFHNFGGEGQNPNLPPPANRGLFEEHILQEISGYGMIQQYVLKQWMLQAGLRITHHSQYGTQATPQYGISFIPNDKSSLKLSGGRAYRNPSVLDLFLFPPANSELEPEESINFELAWNQDIGQNFTSEASIFYMEGENMIQIVPQAAGPPKRLNTGAFEQWGLELSAKLQLGQSFQLSSNYTYLDYEDIRLYAPRHDWSFFTTYQKDPVIIRFQFRRIDGLYNSLQSNQTTDYALINAYAQYRIFKGISIFVDGQNLGNVSYSIDTGYPMPGTSVMGGVKWRLGR